MSTSEVQEPTEEQVDIPAASAPVKVEQLGPFDRKTEKQHVRDKTHRFIAKQTHAVIVPSYASWFDFNKVNEIEREAFPDFCSNSFPGRTVETYIEARNFMVNTFRLSPYEYLTVTAVRKNMALDVNTVIRMHAFLEQWGLINYQIDPKQKNSLWGPKYKGTYVTELDVPECFKPVAREDDPECSEPLPLDVPLTEHIYESTNQYKLLQSQDKPSRTLNKLFICHTCGNDISHYRYHNLRAKDINICARCHQEGHFGGNFQASDFIRLDCIPSNNSAIWSDQELFLLLEGIEMYEHQWQKICEHIGNKTVEQCVQKFLCLPIEDQYVNSVINRDNSKTSTTVQDVKNHLMDIQYSANAEMSQSVIRKTLNTIESSHLNTISNEESNSLLEETKATNDKVAELVLGLLDDKFEKFLIIEHELMDLQQQFTHEFEKTLNDRVLLSKQVLDISTDISGESVKKRLVGNKFWDLSNMPALLDYNKAASVRDANEYPAISCSEDNIYKACIL